MDDGVDFIGVLEQARHIERLEARIDVGHEGGRGGEGFDRAEQHALGHARDRAELRGRVDLDLQFIAHAGFDFLLEFLLPLVLHVVDGRRSELHGGLRIGGATERQEDCKGCGGKSASRHLQAGLQCHSVTPYALHSIRTCREAAIAKALGRG